MSWKIEFYDHKVVREISAWPVHIKAKFTRIVELLEKYGPHELGMPHVKPLGQGLSEIRVKSVEGIARAPFCINERKVVVILSGFIKKTQKMPARELAIAKQRMKEVKNNA